MMVPLGLGKGHCFLPAVVDIVLVIAFVDCAIAVITFYQLLRIHSRSQQLGWTRQKVKQLQHFTLIGRKVFHFLIDCSNFGYFVYFVLTLVATCNGWKIWSPYSFVLIASPKILCFTSFLLLLSFWIDLCHQTNDEDEDEECSSRVTLLQSPLAKPGSSNVDGQARCLPLHYFRVRSHPRIVVLVACLIAVVMISVAVGIGVGGDAPYFSSFFLFIRLRKLACIPSENLSLLQVLYCVQEQQTSNAYMTVLIILYYFVGSSVPSAFLLWIMRELPQPISPSVREEPATVTFITNSSVSVQRPPQWTTTRSLPNQVLRSSLSPI